MKITLFISFITLHSCQMPSTNSTSDRLVTARQQKSKLVEELLKKYQLDTNQMHLYLRAFKAEKELEVWAKPKDNAQYQLIKTYPFCASSGNLGPKRKEGDRQIPEGFYHIDVMNPKSKFLLSMRINYPNASDKVRSHPTQPGSDIYIHGGCASVGCIPITDEGIQELYLLILPIWQRKANIPVSIFPFRMESEALEKLDSKYQAYLPFWEELLPGYTIFERHRLLFRVEINEQGIYRVGGN